MNISTTLTIPSKEYTTIKSRTVPEMLIFILDVRNTTANPPSIDATPPTTKIRDQYVQHFFTNISNNIRLEKYCVFKNKFCFEEYLYCLNPRLRTILCKYRCSYHKLLIVQGRPMNIEKMQVQIIMYKIKKHYTKYS